MGFGLYEASFATVAGLYGRDARNAITGITLFAGFASTVGWPASAFFIEQFGWRGACIAWAVLHLVIGLPMNRLLVPKTPPQAPRDTASRGSAVRHLLDDDRARRRVCRRAGSSRPRWPPICRGFWKRWVRRRRRQSSPARSSVRPRWPRVSLSSLCCSVFRRWSRRASRPVCIRSAPCSGLLRAGWRCRSSCCMAPATACSPSRAAPCRSPCSGRRLRPAHRHHLGAVAHPAGRRAASLRPRARWQRAAYGAAALGRADRSSFLALFLLSAAHRPNARASARIDPPPGGLRHRSTDS